jgi:preprotein translocase subunit SecA
VIYQQRNDILDAKDMHAQITALREGCITDLVRQHVPAESVEEQWDLPGLEKVLAEELGLSLDLQGKVQASSAISDEDLLEMVVAAANTQFQNKLDSVGAESFVSFERMILLQSIDTHWREHLSALDYLRQGIHLRGYAQKQPKQEYKREAFELFGQLLDAVKNEVTKTLMMVRIDSGDQMQQAAQAIEERAEQISNVTYTAPDETGQPQVQAAGAALAAGGLAELANTWGQVGRNEPCPCGSGNKFKQCHGKLA